MIKVLHKALDILEYISSDKNKHYSLTEIAEVINEKPTTCSNILMTLLKRGYVERAGTRGYKLGIMAYKLVNMAGYDVVLVAAAKEAMKRFSEKIGADSVLSVLKNKRKHVLIRVESKSIIKVDFSAMDISDPYLTSTGLLLLSYEEESTVKDLIRKNGIPSIFSLEEEYICFLSGVRNDGYLSMTIKKEIAEVAAPIIVNGNVIAAIGVYMPQYKFTSEFSEIVIDSILYTAKEIAGSLAE